LKYPEAKLQKVKRRKGFWGENVLWALHDEGGEETLSAQVRMNLGRGESGGCLIIKG